MKYEVGDRAITSRDVISMTYCINKGTVVTITNIGARGYDLVDDTGHEVIECRFDCLAPMPEEDYE